MKYRRFRASFSRMSRFHCCAGRAGNRTGFKATALSIVALDYLRFTGSLHPPCSSRHHLDWPGIAAGVTPPLPFVDLDHLTLALLALPLSGQFFGYGRLAVACLHPTMALIYWTRRSVSWYF